MDILRTVSARMLDVELLRELQSFPASHEPTPQESAAPTTEPVWRVFFDVGPSRRDGPLPSFRLQLYSPGTMFTSDECFTVMKAALSERGYGYDGGKEAPLLLSARVPPPLPVGLDHSS